MRWWMKLIFGVAVIIILVWLFLRVGDFALDVLGEYNGDRVSAHDPMFAEEPEETPMPILSTEETPLRDFEDNSANWETGEQVPVEKTIEELGKEVFAVSDS